MLGRFVPFIIIVTLIISCWREKSVSELTNIQIDPADSSRTTFSDYFELEKYIILENTESSVIQSIRKISIVGDKIFILTWGDAKVMIFDIKGKLITVIDKNGRGPGEYNYVVDISVSSKGDTIKLFDKDMMKILYYNLKGELIQTVNLNTDLETFTVLPNGTILGYSFLNIVEAFNDTIYQLWYFNSRGKILKGFLPVKKDYLGYSMGLPSTFSSTETGLYFMPYTEHTVYKITENPLKITKCYKLDFKDKSMPSNLLEMSRKDTWKAFESSFIVSGEYIGRKVLLFNIRSEKNYLVAFYNLKTKKHSLINSKNVWDRVNELPLETNIQNTYSSDDRIITIIHPFKLLSHDFENKESLGNQLKQKVKETDNPILGIYREKD